MASNTDLRQPLSEEQQKRLLDLDEEIPKKNAELLIGKVHTKDHTETQKELANLISERNSLLKQKEQYKVQQDLEILNEKIKPLEEKLHNLPRGETLEKQEPLLAELSPLLKERLRLRRLIRAHNLKEQEEEIKNLNLNDPENKRRLLQKKIEILEGRISELQVNPDQDPLVQQQLLEGKQKLIATYKNQLEQISKNKYLKYKNKYLQLKKLLANRN